MNNKNILIFGDIAAIAILTLVGFATHDELGVSNIPRMGTTFFPVLIGWFLVAPWLGLFDLPVIANPKLFWRILLAMLFVAPLAVVLRAALLHSAVQPLFALILGGSNALGMLIWRGGYYLAGRRTR